MMKRSKASIPIDSILSLSLTFLVLKLLKLLDSAQSPMDLLLSYSTMVTSINIMLYYINPIDRLLLCYLNKNSLKGGYSKDAHLHYIREAFWSSYLNSLRDKIRLMAYIVASLIIAAIISVLSVPTDYRTTIIIILFALATILTVSISTPKTDLRRLRLFSWTVAFYLYHVNRAMYVVRTDTMTGNMMHPINLFSYAQRALQQGDFCEAIFWLRKLRAYGDFPVAEELTKSCAGHSTESGIEAH